MVMSYAFLRKYNFLFICSFSLFEFLLKDICIFLRSYIFGYHKIFMSKLMLAHAIIFLSALIIIILKQSGPIHLDDIYVGPLRLWMFKLS